MPPQKLQSPFPVVLATASPRRIRLLEELFDRFEVAPAEVEERLPDVGDPREVAVRIAEEKAAVTSNRFPQALVIAGDTVVAIADEGGYRLLAKPRDRDDACRMLRLLSGRTHEVVTGVALRWPGGAQRFAETSRVTFRRLSNEEIESYVATGEPLDKAGGYGLQSMGRALVESIDGSESNVVGLPVEALRSVWGNLGLERKE